jgi:hypothetical protein
MLKLGILFLIQTHLFELRIVRLFIRFLIWTRKNSEISFVSTVWKGHTDNAKVSKTTARHT